MDSISQTTFSNPFYEWECGSFALDFIEICSEVSILQYSSIIGPDNGLAPSRRQAIIWTNGYKFADAYMRHSFSMS